MWMTGNQNACLIYNKCTAWELVYTTLYKSKMNHSQILYILNAKNLAPLSFSIFSGSKLISSNFSVNQMMCPCRKIIFVTNSNA